MGVGKFNEFQGVKENIGQVATDNQNTPVLQKSDAKANALFSTKKPELGKEIASPATTSTRRNHSTSPKQSVKELISSVKNAVTTKLKNISNKIHNHSSETSIPQKVRNLFLKDGTLQKQQALRDLEKALLPHAGSKNRAGAMDAAVNCMAKADRAGILDLKLCKSMTRQLERSLTNPRQSISLEDIEKPTAQINIFHELMGSKHLKSDLRSKLEAFGHIEETRQTLHAALQASTEINLDTAKKILDKALETYPTHNETTFEIDGKSYTALLLPNSQNKPDILVKQEKIGEGASAVAYKAVSLTSQAQVVVKYATSIATASNEEENAIDIIRHVTPDGEHTEGIQKPMQLFTLQTPEGPKKVTVSQFYENCDYGANVLKEQFFVEVLKIPREELHFDTPEQAKEVMLKAQGKLKQLNEDLKAYFLGPASKDEKNQQLAHFAKEYTGILTALIGSEKTNKLLDAYRALIES